MRADRLAAPLAAIAAAGLALRLGYIALTPHLRGFGDSLFYHSIAGAIASGRGFVDPTFGTATALHPPLLPLWLAFVWKLGGHGWVAQRISLAILDSAAIPVIGLIAHRVSGRRAALVAATLAALYPVFVSADTAVMPEGPFGLLVALGLLQALSLRATAPRAIALGVTIALAGLTRSEGLLLLVLAALPAALALERRRAATFALACLACACVYAPWTVRNLQTFKRPVVTSTNQGTMLAGANCHDTYYGRDVGGWQIACVPRYVGKDESQSASSEQSAALRYARRHAGRVPLVAVVRVARTFDLYQPLRQARHAEGRGTAMELAGTFAFYLVAALALAGAPRLRGLRLWLLLSPIVLAIVISAFGYGVPRFREPADVALVALAAIAVGGTAGAGSSIASPRAAGPGERTRRLSRRIGRSTA